MRLYSYCLQPLSVLAGGRSFHLPRRLPSKSLHLKEGELRRLLSCLRWTQVSAIGSVIVGIVGAQIGYSSLYFYSSIFVLAGLIVYYLLHGKVSRSHRKRAKEQELELSKAAFSNPSEILLIFEANLLNSPFPATSIR